ncbi:alpha/beta hydrolase, partial [Sinorhizobium sp. 6-70]|nr:alpha/beta hydrolase [Sinorhizobium sp. 6-70]MDK1482674.1 alpha/beta hydrolase [Sinorhizobium sp. 6-117]
MTRISASVRTNGISRRDVLAGTLGAAAAVSAVRPASAAAVAANATTTTSEGARTMGSRIVTRDGVEIYYKDWGPKDGPVV